MTGSVVGAPCAYDSLDPLAMCIESPARYVAAGSNEIVRRRNAVTSEVLEYLAELDERRLFLPLGFASLFEYCVVALGICEPTAGRHIAAARVCRAHPEAFAMERFGVAHVRDMILRKRSRRLQTRAAGFGDSTDATELR